MWAQFAEIIPLYRHTLLVVSRWSGRAYIELVEFGDAIPQTIKAASDYLTRCCFWSSVSNQSTHSDLRLLLSTEFSSGQLPRTSYFLSLGQEVNNTNGFFWFLYFTFWCTIWISAPWLNALSCCRVIGWTAFCVTKQFKFYLNCNIFSSFFHSSLAQACECFWYKWWD